MSDDLYVIKPDDKLDFHKGVLYVEMKPFFVVTIDGDLPDGPVVGVSGRRILTDFKTLTNEWDADTVAGRFYSDRLTRIEHLIRCVDDCLDEWEGSTEEAMRYVVDALRSLLMEMVKREQ